MELANDTRSAVAIFGLNARATIRRIAKDISDAGDAVAAGLPVVIAEDIRCTLQATRAPQDFMLSGQVNVNTCRIWFRHGVDVQVNDFIDITLKGTTTTWTAEGVLDEAGRAHHLIIDAKRYQ